MRWLRFCISCIFGLADGLWVRLRRMGGHVCPPRCVVLYYHSIRPEHRRRFGHQLDILARHAAPISLDRTKPLQSGRCYAAVTFDDGFKNVAENALPELERRQIPCTIFVIVSALGQYPHWLTDPENPAHRDRVLSESELISISSDLVSIGSHTMTHPLLPSLPEADARRELLSSRMELQEILKRDIRFFSFPYGAVNGSLIKWCEESGYERVFTSSPVLAFSDPKEFVTGRVSVEPTDWDLEFKLKVLGAYRWLPVVSRLKQYLVGRANPACASAMKESSQESDPSRAFSRD
jgi:peptidoglycan/xylan/chitin deacetylase (PgdA/CDA1 family)